MSEYISHYGIKRRSGRYPWGSGKKYQRSKDFLMRVDDYKDSHPNAKEKDIAAALGMSVNKYRSEVTYANFHRKVSLWDNVQEGIEKGLTPTEIGKEFDMPESTIRKYRDMEDPRNTGKNQKLRTVEAELIRQVKEKGYLDIGPGTELQLGVSKETLKTVVERLKDEGYYIHNDIYVKQVAGNQNAYTTMKVLTKEKDSAVVRANKDKIRPPESHYDSELGEFRSLGPVKSISHKKVGIVYKEDGGEDRDGLMLIRKGAKDLDLGNSSYAQVRIGVDGTHYLKGMAMYGDVPEGKDILFYTNKSKSKSWDKVLKEMEPGDNPFGATIKAGGQRGSLNIVNEEGDWSSWKPSFSSQFLSKQPFNLVRERVSTTIEKKKNQLEEILSLTNPALKKKMLNEYADDLDGSARSLKLQSFPKTGNHVILPFPTMKANEVYAPNYRDGEHVVLVRHPHGGRFELPELVVNNKGPARKILGQVHDAIGIHPSVAGKLSGADFDGDTVLVIPNKGRSIKTAKSLQELKGFDPKDKYSVGMQTMSKKERNTQMGIASNLITDMSLKGASPGELASAVKHSMVVIDAYKHKLDWKQSAIDNNISALQKKYQAHTAKVDVDPMTGRKKKGTISTYEADLIKGKYHKTGASTIISKADKAIDVYSPTKLVEVKSKNSKGIETIKMKPKRLGTVKIMDLIDDAYKLSSGSPNENEYARYANSMKKMAAKTRMEADKIKVPTVDKLAQKIYKNEVSSLKNKLNKALMNAPRERQAQLLANKKYAEATKERILDTEQKKKLKGQLLVASRKATGAKKENIKITPKEWEAIQKNAFAKSVVEDILKNADQDVLKELASPKARVSVTSSQRGRILALKGNGYTQAEIAEALGLSTSTINSVING